MMLTSIEISGIDVTSYCVNYQLERTYGDLTPEVEMKFVRGITSALTLVEGATLEIWRGWVTATDEKIFSGYIEKFESEGGLITITGIDKLWDLIRKEVTHVYDQNVDASAGKISEIFLDLVTTYGGLNADATTVQDSGSIYLLDKFVCNHTDIMERCKKLADILDWQFYYRADTDKVYFEPQGFSTNATILTVGSNIIGIPKWNYDTTEMINDLTLVGAYQEVETTKSGRIGTTSGFTNDDITLDYTPISVKVYGDASNPPTTLKTGGLPDSTSSYDYYVDKNQKKIIPAIGTSFTTDDYYEVRYSLAVPIPIHLYNQYSIDTYGKFKKTITLKDLRNVADAEVRATNLLTKYSTPFLYATGKVKSDSSYGLMVGQKIQVIDNISRPTVNDVLLINKHRIRYPADYDELDVGDKFWRLAEFNANIMEKLKRIEEDELANEDLVTELVTINNADFSPIETINRYKKITSQAPTSANNLIWKHPVQGFWGSPFLWTSSASAWTAEANVYIRQYLNAYQETFYDNDFKDTGSTTATWDTSAKTLSFTVGQVAQSTSIDYNNGTISTATMEVTISSGTPVLYLSADGGSNWESVTSGTPHTFTNTGTDLRWKITSAGSTTLTKIEITNYH